MALPRLLRVLVVIAVTMVASPIPSALAACEGVAYRVEVASEDGDAWSLRTCGRSGVGLLAWSRVDPFDRSDRPEGDLGPRYVLVVERRDPSSDRWVARQDLYPLAEGGPVVFAAPGQIFFHPAAGGTYTMRTGWAPIDLTGDWAERFRRLGAPLPVAGAPVPPGEPTEDPSPTSDASPVADEADAEGPDLVTLLAVGVLAAAAVALMLRKRSGS